MLPRIFLPFLSLLLLVDLIALANGTYVKIPAYSTTTAKPVTTFATTTAAPGSGVKLPSYPIALPAGQAVVEVFVVIDKELGDVFQGNYGKIVDYLSIYFWDINTRYKSLWSVDISFKFSEVLVIRSTSDQPFIEKSRAADGTVSNSQQYVSSVYSVYRV